MKVKTLTLSLTTLILSTFGGLQADYPYWENCCEPCFLSSAQPCGEDCGPFFGGSFLWLTTYKTNTDFASDAVVEVVEGTTIVEHVGKFHHFRPEWDPGFRVLAGYRLGEDGWDARAVYTYFHNSSHSNASPTEGADRVFMNLFSPLSALTSESATAKESLNYNTADLLFSRPYIVSCTHLVRPFFGVRGLWVTNKENVRYNSILGIPDTDGLVKHHARWEGVGLHAGFEYVLNICDCLSLSADFSASLLAARQKEHFLTTQINNVTGDLLGTFADYSEKTLFCLPGYDLGTYLNWETEFCCYCMIFSVGYEMHQWFGVPTVRRFDPINTSYNNVTNLLIHGANVSATLYF